MNHADDKSRRHSGYRPLIRSRSVEVEGEELFVFGVVTTQDAQKKED